MENVSLHLASCSNDCFWDISFLETARLIRWHSLWNQMTAPHQLILYQDTPFQKLHYNDVKMGAVASQITSLTAVHWTVYSDADQRKHQSSMSLAFVLGIYRDWWIPRTKGQLREKCLHLMTSWWLERSPNVISHLHPHSQQQFIPYAPSYLGQCGIGQFIN